MAREHPLKGQAIYLAAFARPVRVRNREILDHLRYPGPLPSLCGVAAISTKESARQWIASWGIRLCAAIPLS
jgi:hypothetical protein